MSYAKTSSEKADPKIVEEINKLTQIEMAYLHRFAPAGHIYFDGRLPYAEIFKQRFNELGGMTPEISKAIGWEQ